MDPGEIQRAIESLPVAAEQELLTWLKARARARRYPSRKPRPAVVRPPATLRDAVRWTALTLFCFLATEGIIFHSGVYSHFLEPDSSAGVLEGQMTWLGDTAAGAKPEIFLVGDSRVAEGFSARAAVESAGGRYDFWNLGVPGTSPRVWYYIVRDALRSHRAPAAIVVGLDHYSDVDGIEKPQSRVSDISFLTGRLTLGDCYDFAASMEVPEFWSPPLAGCLFRGLPLRADVHEFLLHPWARIRRARDFRLHGHGYIDGYGGKLDVLTGLSVDLAKRSFYFPPELKNWQKESITNSLRFDVAVQTGDVTRYRRQWLGRLAGLLVGSRTRLIFVEMPRGPLPFPEATEPARFVNQAVTQRGVSALPADLFHDLERPDLFADGLHLNVTGRNLFSTRLGQRLAAELGAGR